MFVVIFYLHFSNPHRADFPIKCCIRNLVSPGSDLPGTKFYSNRYLVMSTKHKTSSSGKKKWSADVTANSGALDLENKVFKGTPQEIALSLKKSAEASKRRKTSPYRSAMSMLTLYINRAGKNLSAAEKEKMEKAKDELRAQFGKEPEREKES